VGRLNDEFVNVNCQLNTDVNQHRREQIAMNSRPITRQAPVDKQQQTHVGAECRHDPRPSVHLDSN